LTRRVKVPELLARELERFERANPRSLARDPADPTEADVDLHTKVFEDVAGELAGR
jgi:hypothetical protein